jgi:hypothetical protein
MPSSSSGGQSSESVNFHGFDRSIINGLKSVKATCLMELRTPSKQMSGTRLPHGRVSDICFEGVHVHHLCRGSVTAHQL